MSVVVSDLVARVRAEGVQETAQQVRAVGDAAAQTARALQIMAEAAAKQGGGGTAAGWMEIFTRGNVQPTAAALAQAAQEMQRTAAAAQQAVQPAQSVARAAADHASAAQNGARATQAVAEGWKLSESSAVRFAAGIAGVSLGISLVAGAARLIHDTIESTINSQLDWERSLVQVRALYGDIAPRVVALSEAQAALPGVTLGHQELLQANAAAGFLTTRYGVVPGLTGTLTTEAARLGGLLYPNDQPQQMALQAAFVDYARSGGGTATLEAATGQAYDPLTLARRLGFPSEAALGGLTPQQLATARGYLETANAATANIQGAGQAAPLLDIQRTLQHNLEQTQGQLQSLLEGGGPAGPASMPITAYEAYVGLAGEGAAAPGAAAIGAGPSPAQQAYQQQVDQLTQAVKDAQDALDANSAAQNAQSTALADSQKHLDDANAALSKFGVEANSAAARLLSFTGSLEDATSIARGDVAAQAQGAVATRAQSAIPAFGTPSTEISARATQTAYQQAYQNYVARQAQGSQDNAVRQYLEDVANNGPVDRRQSARQALDEANRTAPVQARLGETQRASAVVDLQTAQTQSQLQQISLSQQERQVQLLRDTVDIRKLDVQQQMAGLDAQNQVIRAQQAALPAQNAVSDAQYQLNRATVLARARMARTLRGEDVSGFPTIDQLIQQNVNAQLDLAEAGPAALEGQRAIEVSQRTATARGLNQQLTQNRIQTGELGVDLQNLGDLPTQTALQLELVQNNRDLLAVQKEERDALLELVQIMGSRVGSSGSIDLGSLVFGEGGDVPAPQTLPGARRGPS